MPFEVSRAGDRVRLAGARSADDGEQTDTTELLLEVLPAAQSEEARQQLVVTESVIALAVSIPAVPGGAAALHRLEFWLYKFGCGASAIKYVLCTF